ncbi:MAG TPA: 5-oxoprolinase subunit PxpA [Psychromonas sp.]
MKLNCDVGESFGHWEMGLDEAVIPWVDMVNIACGFHASDPDVMAKTVQSAVESNVQIGAHPGYNDKIGFGRRSIPHSKKQISHLIAYQTGALQAICQLYGSSVEYVKPHGALYNDMMVDQDIFHAVIAGITKLSPRPALMILAQTDNSLYQGIAEQAGVRLILEAFADRAYTQEGRLAPRSQAGAVYHSAEKIIEQVMQLAKNGCVTTLEGGQLKINADSVCVHGDNPQSVATVEQLFRALNP